MSDQQSITPDDIEAKFTQLKDEIDGTTTAAQDSILKAGVVAAVILIVLVFLIGKRRGRAGRTVVEIRRV